MAGDDQSKEVAPPAEHNQTVPLTERTSYKFLSSRIQFWRFATMVYREVNAVLFVCAKGLVPVLSAIVGTNLALSVRAQPLLSNEVMIWASIAIVIFSGLDTVLNPREKKAIALKVNLELCAIKEAFLIGVENAKTQEEFQKVLEVTSEKLRKVLSDYAAKGWGA